MNLFPFLFPLENRKENILFVNIVNDKNILQQVRTYERNLTIAFAFIDDILKQCNVIVSEYSKIKNYFPIINMD